MRQRRVTPGKSPTRHRMLGSAPTPEECALVQEAYARLRAQNEELYAQFDAESRVLAPREELFLPFQRDQKHFPQTLSIVENLVDLGVLDVENADEQMILEAGSGTGELGLVTALRLTRREHAAEYKSALEEMNRDAGSKERPKRNVIPTTRPEWKRPLFMCDLLAGLKGKQDRYFCFTDFSCVRLQGDLLELGPETLRGLADRVPRGQNVALSVAQARKEAALSVSENHTKRVVVIGKHLCGAATDVVLRYDAAAFGIALCCHCKSDGAAYCNPAYLETLGPQIDSRRLHKLTSYQHCFGEANELDERQKQLREVGFKARQILDVGRLLYLRGRGYACGLVRYSDGSLTGEPWLLWARRE